MRLDDFDTFHFFCVVFSVQIPFCFLMVGLSGLELLTSRLSGVRSNQLSYRPIMVETRRIELLTPCLQGRCSPSWATPPNLASLFSAILCCNCVAFRQRRLLRFHHAPCYASSCEKFLAILLPLQQGNIYTWHILIQNITILSSHLMCSLKTRQCNSLMLRPGYKL